MTHPIDFSGGRGISLPYYIQTPNKNPSESRPCITPEAPLTSGVSLLLQATTFHASTRNAPTHLSWSSFGRFCTSCVLLNILLDPTSNALARNLASDWRALREDIDLLEAKGELDTNMKPSLWREVPKYIFARQDAVEGNIGRADLKANLRGNLLIIVSACLVFTWAYIWIPWDIEFLIISIILPLHHFFNRNSSSAFTQNLIFTTLGVAVLSQKGGDEGSISFRIAHFILSVLQLYFMAAQVWTALVWVLNLRRMRRNRRVNG